MLNVNPLLLEDRWAILIPEWEAGTVTILTKAAEILGPDATGDVSVVLTHDGEVQQLNKIYRQKDKPTNVLSFPSDQEEDLGDIILAYETVLKEAEIEGIPPLHHMTHLIIHGFLHLLGYDHESEEDAQIMETMEIHILAGLNIDNPYEDK